LVDLAPVSSAPVFVDDAFIFFTSGSTGNPKGVWVSQSAVFNSLTWRKSLHDVLASDVFMFKSPAGFDISLWEMLLPLLNGASLIIARPLGHVDMTYLVETIIRKNITIIQFAAPLLQQFVKVAIDVKLTSLRVILCGGEAWEGNLANIVMATFSNVRLFNIYGQTETALGVLAFECDRHKTFQSVPCRNICFNTHLALIEEDGNSITSYDQPGELVVGGVPVSSGYVGGDVATAKSFLEIDTIGRFYRTGDYFVRKENGDWLFLGRRDNQIKLHGVRIELGEIENAASVVPGVAACVAVFSQASRSEIVLFVVSADPALTPKIIRSHIRRRLRGVMVPDRIEFIHSIPLTPNGKVNRNALTGQLKVS
jgi:acyl-coenzyme A synthetase/AMP-(fatty) acid ligase